jgi:hypothetical protein
VGFFACCGSRVSFVAGVKVRLDALAFMDDEPPKSITGDGLDPLSVRVIGKCIGNAIDGSRFGRSTSGLGSS